MCLRIVRSPAPTHHATVTPVGSRAEEVVAAERGPDILRGSGKGVDKQAQTRDNNALGGGLGRSVASYGGSAGGDAQPHRSDDASAPPARTEHALEAREDGTVTVAADSGQPGAGQDHAYPTDHAKGAKTAVGRTHPEGSTRPRGGAENPQPHN